VKQYLKNNSWASEDEGKTRAQEPLNEMAVAGALFGLAATNKDMGG